MAVIEETVIAEAIACGAGHVHVFVGEGAELTVEQSKQLRKEMKAAEKRAVADVETVEGAVHPLFEELLKPFTRFDEATRLGF